MPLGFVLAGPVSEQIGLDETLDRRVCALSTAVVEAIPAIRTCAGSKTQNAARADPPTQRRAVSQPSRYVTVLERRRPVGEKRARSYSSGWCYNQPAVILKCSTPQSDAVTRQRGRSGDDRGLPQGRCLVSWSGRAVCVMTPISWGSEPWGFAREVDSRPWRPSPR